MSDGSADASIELAEFDQDDPAARGEAHGELWRAAIRELAEVRAELTKLKGNFRDLAEVYAVAALHLPLLARFSQELHSELLGIARGAGVTPEQIVVLNHYTDLRDVPASVLAEPPIDDPGGCTSIYVPGEGRGAVLGQTWDMHGTAEPYVRMIRIRPRGGDDEVLLFTLTGCLGMTGLTADGVGVTINNLSSTDGQVGVVWPALVRSMLAAGSATAARDRLMATRLSSGHHYMMGDGHTFFGVETSGKLKIVTQVGARAAHLHTNHCFDPVLRRHERVPAVSTTFRRLELASTLYVQQRPSDLAGVWNLLASHDGYPNSLCSHIDAGDPSAAKTCGLMALQLATGEVWSTRGCGRASPPRKLSLSRWRGGRAPEPR